MAGGTKTKNYYGVGVGRGGPRVYRTWSEVNGFPNSRYRGFMTLDEAEAWVNGWASTSNPPRSSAHQESLSSVPNVYFVDSNPDYSFDGAEADYIPLPSSPIKFLPSPARKPRQSPISKDMNGVFPEYDSDDQSNSQIKFTDISALPGPPLSQQQLQIVERVKKGESIFFTGSAASTGIAAVNIGGTTLHSFAGIGLGKESVVKLVKKIEDQKTTRESSNVLLVKFVTTQVRLVLIICGDFNQLPPVPDIHDGVQVPIIFAFDARSWNECIGTPIVLNKVFRQSDQNAQRYEVWQIGHEE
ncbi:hypothetical protein DFH11DRAFT_71362 [Phellopilus nigrolimitatus]|nr:hypothetical protein DFH11DRAFT_71362 [Phellopilus nigrolimitatus]